MSAEFYAVPDDTLWLRSGTPFVAGESDRSGVLFPPTPWTWQGMVRSRLLVAGLGDALATTSRDEIARRVGPPDRLPEGWRLRGPLPAQERTIDSGTPRLEPWVPWPSFLSAPRGGGARAPRRSRSPGAKPDGLVDFSRPAGGSELQVLAFGEGDKAGAGWISASNLLWALLGRGTWERDAARPADKSRTGAGVLPDFIAEEARPGVAVTRDTGRAAEHMLYTAVHHRFAPGSGLWGALEGASPDDVRALRDGPAYLGRRDRTIRLGHLPTVAGWDALLDGRHLDGLERTPGPIHLRVVLLTPAVVEPDQPAPFALPPGATLRGVQASAGPAIGGFDRVGHGGRPVRGTWAGGSSFWVEIAAAPPSGDPGDRAWIASRGRILRHLGGQPDHPSELERFGFGARVAAAFDPETGLPLPSENRHA